MKTVQRLEDELESLWTDFEELQKWSGDTMDELLAARQRNGELVYIIARLVERQ
jgi:hypothetical protein